MRTRSMLLAGVAGLAVAAFAGSALAQNAPSWGTTETTYFHSTATSAFFPNRPNAPSFATQWQPGLVMHFQTPNNGSSPGIAPGRRSQPTSDD